MRVCVCVCVGSGGVRERFWGEEARVVVVGMTHRVGLQCSLASYRRIALSNDLLNLNHITTHNNISGADTHTHTYTQSNTHTHTLAHTHTHLVCYAHAGWPPFPSYPAIRHAQCGPSGLCVCVCTGVCVCDEDSPRVYMFMCA